MKNNAVKIERYNSVSYVKRNHPAIKIKKQEDRLEYLLDRIYEETGIDCTNPISKREYCYARTVYFKLGIALTALSYEKIAGKCQKHHATVIHSINNLWPEIEIHRKDLVEIYDRILNNIDEQQFIKAQILKKDLEIKKLNETIKNIKDEINTEYFSLQQKLVNIKKAAYNVSSLLDMK